MKSKNKITSFILALSILFSLFTINSFAASYRDAYDVIMISTIDGATKQGYDVSRGFLGSMSNGQGYYLDGVDFGNSAPTYLEIGIGVPDEYAGSKFQVILDEMSGTVIAEFEATTSGAFEKSTIRKIPVTKKVTGQHRVYIKKLSGAPTNLYTLQFYAPLTNVDLYSEYSEGNNLFSDITDSKYKDEINALATFGVIGTSENDTNYYPDFYIRRIDFAKMIYRLLNEKWYDNTEQIFQDVSGEKENVLSVNYLYEKDIISEKGRFNPNDNLTLQDACMMLTRALGYSFDADTKNYYSIASKLGILEGIKNIGKNIRKDEAAKLVYNTALAEKLTYDINSKSYKFNNDGKKLITETMGYVKDRGIVSATNNTTLTTSESFIDYKTVIINGEDFSTGKTDAKSLLGFECDFFYSDDEEKTLIAINPVKNVEYIRLDSRQYEIEEITGKEIKYNDGNKDEEIRLDDDTAIIYNGVVIDRTIEEIIDVMPLKGSIRYIKNPHECNVLFVNEYTNFLIESFDSFKEILTDKITGKTIKYDSTEDYVYCTKNGQNIRLKDMRPEDVVMMYVSKNTHGGRVIRFVIDGGKKEGTVEAVNSDYIKIDGTNYDKDSNIGNIAVGSYIEFYVNALDEIIYTKNIIKVDNIGLYYGSYVDEDEVLYIKILTSDNKKISLPCNEKIYIDGEKIVGSEAGKNLLDSYSGKIDKTPVRYSIYKRKVSMIDTINENNNGIRDSVVKLAAGQKYQYERSTRVFVNKSKGAVEAVLSEDGQFIEIKNDGKSIDDYSFVGVRGDMTDMIGDLYSFDKDGFYADLFMVMTKNRKEDYRKVFVFEDSYTIMDDEEDSYQIIKGFNISGNIEYKVKLDEIDKNELWLVNYLKEGDLIRVMSDKDDIVSKLQIVYAQDGKDSREYYTSTGEKKNASYLLNDNDYSSGYNNQDVRHIIGKVTERTDDYVKLTHNDGTCEIVALGGRKAINTENELSDPKVGDKMYTYIYQRKTQDIIILE